VNDTIKTTDDVARRLNLATLALVPGPMHAVAQRLAPSEPSSVTAQGRSS
jgi:hypothetical protein